MKSEHFFMIHKIGNFKATNTKITRIVLYLFSGFPKVFFTLEIPLIHYSIYLIIQIIEG